jgi:hypothetical protein
MTCDETLTVHLLETVIFILIMAIICIVPLLIQEEMAYKESKKKWNGKDRRKL